MTVEPFSVRSTAACCGCWPRCWAARFRCGRADAECVTTKYPPMKMPRGVWAIFCICGLENCCNFVGLSVDANALYVHWRITPFHWASDDWCDNHECHAFWRVCNEIKILYPIFWEIDVVPWFKSSICPSGCGY